MEFLAEYGHYRLYAFDFDGTLFETLPLNAYAYSQAAHKYGAELSPRIYARKCDGRDYRDFLADVCGITDPQIQKKIHDEKKRIYLENLHMIRENRDLLQLAEKVRARAQNGAAVLTALVTTASRELVLRVLEQFHIDCFDIFVTKEDIHAQKPAPDCYLKAMEIAGVKPSETVCFEDSLAGIRSAKAAGASVIKINIRNGIKGA